MLASRADYKVGIYVRLSQEDARMGESVSIENQKNMLVKYCTEQGWHDYSIYCDDGYSGGNFERPDVKRLIEDAKDGKINLILVKDLSRFGRNYIQVGQFTDYLFPMIRCRFIAVNDSVDTLLNDNDMMPFQNLFNEFHCKETSKKTKAVKKACAKDGKFVGPMPPIGYLKSPEDKHKFVIDEQGAAIVRKIFELRCLGYGYQKIAGIINQTGFPAPRDYYYQQIGESTSNGVARNHNWNDCTIKRILLNAAYIGNMVQGKTGTVSYKNKHEYWKPPEEWITVENTHEPIIDLDTWNAVQEINAKNMRTRSTKKADEITLFGGLLRCADCGFKLRFHSKSHGKADGSKANYVSYICGSYARSGKSACSQHKIKSSLLTELVRLDIQSYAKRAVENEQTLRDDLMRERASLTKQQQKTEKATLKAAEKRLSELERLTQALYEDKVLGSIPEATFKSLMSKYELERAEKSALIAELIGKITETEKSQDNIDNYIANIKKYVEVNQLDREMLLELINCIDVGEIKRENGQTSQEIRIHYNLLDKVQ
ncbi:MAG: recombinase family protein [Hydrogenoanaerobacterium sp.]